MSGLVAGRLLLGDGASSLTLARIGDVEIDTQGPYDVELGEEAIEVETIDPLTVCQPG